MNEQNNNGSRMSLSQALDLIKSREGKNYNIEKVNLAELQRLTGITRAKFSFVSRKIILLHCK